MSIPRRAAAVALCFFLAACAGTPGPGEPGYPYNVTGSYSGQLTVEGQVISATLSLETAKGGAVTGEVRVAEMGITARVEGTVVGNQFNLRITYRNPGSGCDGVAESTATIGEGGATISGPLAVTECAQSMGGSLSFKR
jgi:hypothetical protein